VGGRKSKIEKGGYGEKEKERVIKGKSNRRKERREEREKKRERISKREIERNR